MTKEKQNKLIAEQLGFTEVRGYLVGTDDSVSCLFGKEPTTKKLCYVGNYSRDLNVLHNAEKTLTHQQEFVYHDELHNLCKSGARHPCYEAIRATAAQRAEAFLKTIGKWEN
jgi:hypothetical protein